MFARQALTQKLTRPLRPTTKKLTSSHLTLRRVPGTTRTMATGGTISLSPSTAGTYHVPSITSESSKKASELLQRNHDDNHIFFNESGFHNHQAHHLLAIFALGASPDQLQRAFDVNQSYQRPQYPLNERNVQDLADPKRFEECLGKEKYFHDFEDFFRKEIDEKGYQAVVKEYLLKGDPRANDLLWRTYAGESHPLLPFTLPTFRVLTLPIQVSTTP